MIEPKAFEPPPGGLKVKFCPECATALFIELDGWPQWAFPFASAVDTQPPVPPRRIHIQWAGRVAWSPVAPGPNDTIFEANTDESVMEWHERPARLASRRLVQSDATVAPVISAACRLRCRDPRIATGLPSAFGGTGYACIHRRCPPLL